VAKAYTNSPQTSLYYARKRRKARAQLTNGKHGGMQVPSPCGLAVTMVVKALKVG
jgi:hypothetical protein